jgi:hypothetical protein
MKLEVSSPFEMEEAMAVIHVILCFTLSLSVAGTTAGMQSAVRTSDNQQSELRLSTTVVNERYCLERGFRVLRWTLKLTYTNAGGEPILLDRKSSLIYRVMASKNLKAALAGSYNYDQSFSFLDLNKAGMRGGNAPEEEAFVTLKPSESYTIMKDSAVDLRDGGKNSKGFLDAGDYVLQVRIATWYYFADPASYRERWRDRGYLWSNNITSDPMPFTIQKRPTFQQ